MKCECKEAHAVGCDCQNEATETLRYLDPGSEESVVVHLCSECVDNSKITYDGLVCRKVTP